MMRLRRCSAASQAQVQHRQFFLEIRPEQHDRGRTGGLVDGGTIETQQADGEAVAQLGAHVGGADDLVGEAGPGEGVFVGANARPGR